MRAGYSSKMGSAEVVRPPLAEWIRLYHITTTESGMSDIALRRMKVARFLDLNDPFELLALNLRDKPKATRKRFAELKTTYDTVRVFCVSVRIGPIPYSGATTATTPTRFSSPTL